MINNIKVTITDDEKIRVVKRFESIYRPRRQSRDSFAFYPHGRNHDKRFLQIYDDMLNGDFGEFRTYRNGNYEIEISSMFLEHWKPCLFTWSPITKG